MFLKYFNSVHSAIILELSSGKEAHFCGKGSFGAESCGARAVDVSGQWERQGDLSRGSKQPVMFFPVTSVFGKQVLL